MKYYLNDKNEFVIENYNQTKPFSSFFPGIAGKLGIPIWAFYVNRGQAIASFGVKDKNHSVMEFYSASRAYLLTSLIGFRTFIKLQKGGSFIFYDAFNTKSAVSSFDIANKMLISPHELKLCETNRTLGLEIEILYFTIPNDNFGALARRLTVKNISKTRKTLEILDGLPQVIPAGLNNMFLKYLPRTMEAWMVVENLENNVPFIRLKVDPADRPEVVHIRQGNFYAAFDNKRILKPIIDPEAIFGHATDFTIPEVFLRKDFSYPAEQLAQNKFPSCMCHKNLSLSPQGLCTIYSLIGNMSSLEKLKADIKRISKQSYILSKQNENKGVISELMDNSFTGSGSRSFNLYCQQNYLDNVMRGGYPLSFKDKDRFTNINIFSRKHGDLERDYNNFHIEPTHFSQGDGNYRDANQNRRNDAWFNPQVMDDNVHAFFDLIQTDGYNPLVIKPDRFLFKQNFSVLNRFFNKSDLPRAKDFIKRPFTPGEVLAFLESQKIKLKTKAEEFIKTIVLNSAKTHEAEHGEGFWIDHWYYCLDLVESYLLLYPGNLKKMLFENKDFTFFDNAETVKPRFQKYTLKGSCVFQYHSVVKNHDKHEMIAKRNTFKHLSRDEKGKGKIYKTNLITKMLVIVANKFACLDPFGVGIEMEADKPGWYDALNGLAGMLGSSTCETLELKRWIIFIKDSVSKTGLDKKHTINIPSELYKLLVGLDALLKKGYDNYLYWDISHNELEEYRRNTLFGFSGSHKKLTAEKLNFMLDDFLFKIETGLKKAKDKKTDLMHTYFINTVTDYEELSNGAIKPTAFKQKPLPLFLEGTVHNLRTIAESEKAKEVFRSVRKSPLYDKKLKMYKVCASLKDMPREIGRAQIFTPGWLENESIWLHMEYKYMLELLKKGLYEEFYSDFKNVLVPFQNPARYGRSILENSSFMVSSAFPQKKLWGNGFAARLSGATAEFIHIWLIMCTGLKPFYLDENKRLCLELKPILPGWLFTEKQENGFDKDTFSFKFLGKTIVTYHNVRRKNTFGRNAAKITRLKIKPYNKPAFIINGSVLPAPVSYDVRAGKIEKIDVLLS